MKYLEPYKLFESTEVGDEEAAELIEECKDIIETFNEAEDKFKVMYYRTGFIEHGSFDRFNSSQSHELDESVIQFYLALSSNVSGNHISDNKEPITIEGVDDLIGLLTKSKLLIQRLSRYCERIYYKLHDDSAKFILKFSNPDKVSSKRAKVQRLYKILQDAFKDYETWKTLELYRGYMPDNTPENHKKLYNLIKSNPKLIDGERGDKWDTSRGSTGLSLRFSSSDSIEGDSIIINVSGFKYKTYRMDKYKSIRLTNEEKEEAMKCIDQKISEIWNYYSYKINLDSIESSIDGDKIKIKVK